MVTRFGKKNALKDIVNQNEKRYHGCIFKKGFGLIYVDPYSLSCRETQNICQTSSNL